MFLLRTHIEFDTVVEKCTWDEQRRKWLIDTRSEGIVTQGREADVVINAAGILNHNHNPEIPALENFKGTMMHTAEWDHTVDFAGKKVGAIGAGASVDISRVIRFDHGDATYTKIAKESHDTWLSSVIFWDAFFPSPFALMASGENGRQYMKKCTTCLDQLNCPTQQKRDQNIWFSTRSFRRQVYLATAIRTLNGQTLKKRLSPSATTVLKLASRSPVATKVPSLVLRTGAMAKLPCQKRSAAMRYAETFSSYLRAPGHRSSLQCTI